jgi:transposase InsO family protein
VNRLQQRCAAVPFATTARRGYARQRRQREKEQTLRRHLVRFSYWAQDCGLSLPDVAALLQLAPRTLRLWHTDLHIELAQPLGRPTLRSSRSDRMAVLALLEELGPATSAATLHDCCPWFSRAELEDLVRRYRRVWRLRHRHAPHVLTWQGPGVVWAMDFAQAPQPIDGQYPYLLAVRDLASSQQLLWLPVSDLSARVALLGLSLLFRAYGAPLVLKMDNGSAFLADDTRQFLAESGVAMLFSPARTPQYNGAIEAGIGSLKTRTERHATCQGRPTAWTTDDVEAARLEANATARPKGPTGPTPGQLWAQRRALSPRQRERFQDTVARQLSEVYAREHIPVAGPPSFQDQRRLHREAIRRALVEQGYLLFSRRSIPLPITSQKTAIIS